MYYSESVIQFDFFFCAQYSILHNKGGTQYREYTVISLILMTMSHG